MTTVYVAIRFSFAFLFFAAVFLSPCPPLLPLQSAIIATMSEITGIVLAGGLARRMGGGDKGLQLLKQQPLVQHAINRLAPQVAKIIINANRHPDTYAQYADTVVADIICGYAGPLAGIHAGMTQATSEWILSVPCDSPFFPEDLAPQLFQAAQQNAADVAIAAAAGRAQPVFMLAKRQLAADIAATLAGGNGKIDHWYARLPHVVVEFSDAGAFDNINTLEELTQAEQRLP